MGTGYRPPSREPKGRWARHIHARRREWGWSQTHGFEAVRAQGIGLGAKSRSAYIAIDMGERQPTPDEERVLLEIYGPPPDAEPEPPPAADMTALVAALDRQTAAISELVARLESLAAPAIRAGVEQALREAEEGRGDGGSRHEQPLAPPL